MRARKPTDVFRDMLLDAAILLALLYNFLSTANSFLEYVDTVHLFVDKRNQVNEALIEVLESMMNTGGDQFKTELNCMLSLWRDDLLLVMMNSLQQFPLGNLDVSSVFDITAKMRGYLSLNQCDSRSFREKIFDLIEGIFQLSNVWLQDIDFLGNFPGYWLSDMYMRYEARSQFILQEQCDQHIFSKTATQKDKKHPIFSPRCLKFKITFRAVFFLQKKIKITESAQLCFHANKII